MPTDDFRSPSDARSFPYRQTPYAESASDVRILLRRAEEVEKGRSKTASNDSDRLK